MQSSGVDLFDGTPEAMCPQDIEHFYYSSSLRCGGGARRAQKARRIYELLQD